MNMKRFHEKNMHTALKKIRDELGDDAVIISSEQNSSGVEVVAATDYEVTANSDCVINSKPNKQEANVQNYETVSESKNALPAIQNEITQLRNIIESQTEIISWNKVINQNVVSRRLLQKLSICGFGFNLSKKLLEKYKDENNFDQTWKKIENDIKKSILITKENVMASGGTIALVGSTGVGKTTTIAKIAAQYAMKHGNKDIALISTDHYRIGAHDQISIFANILNVPVIAAGDEKELKTALKVVKDKKLVLIDTAGLSQRDTRVQKIMHTLENTSKDLITYLVVSANSQLCVQKEIINNFSPNKLNGVVISKTDEASQTGGILTALMEQELPIAYETNGQNVPQDIIRPDKKHLFTQAISLGDQFGNMENLHSTELYSELMENV